MAVDWRVPMVDLTRQYQGVEEELDAAARRVIRSGHFLFGDAVRGFEGEFAEWCGGGFGVACANGTDALTLALLALGVGPDDEVISVPNTAFGTVAGIARSGAVCRFADIDPQSWMIDPGSIAPLLNAKTKAVVAVHLYGRVAPIDEIRAVLPEGVHLIEDCAQAHGASFGGTRVGRLSGIGCFSFYPSKNLAALGDAGFVLAADEAVADECSALRFYGQKERDVHADVGLNSRMDEIQAAFLSVLLPRLDGWIETRRRNAAIYDEALASLPLRRPVSIEGSHASHHLYPVATADRDGLMQFLASRGIQTAIHYPVSIPRQPVFAGSEDPIPVAEALAGEILSLPVGPHLEPADVELVADAVADFFETA